MAMYIYGTDPETRELKVRGPFDTETQRQREMGDLLNEGTVTLKIRDRVMAERIIKGMQQEGRLSNMKEESAPHYTGHSKSTKSSSSPLPKFFSGAKSIMKKFTEKDQSSKEEDPWR